MFVPPQPEENIKIVRNSVKFGAARLTQMKASRYFRPVFYGSASAFILVSCSVFYVSYGFSPDPVVIKEELKLSVKDADIFKTPFRMPTEKELSEAAGVHSLMLAERSADISKYELRKKEEFAAVEGQKKASELQGRNEVALANRPVVQSPVYSSPSFAAQTPPWYGGGGAPPIDPYVVPPSVSSVRQPQSYSDMIVAYDAQGRPFYIPRSAIQQGSPPVFYPPQGAYPQPYSGYPYQQPQAPSQSYSNPNYAGVPPTPSVSNRPGWVSAEPSTQATSGEWLPNGEISFEASGLVKIVGDEAVFRQGGKTATFKEGSALPNGEFVKKVDSRKMQIVTNKRKIILVDGG